MERDTSFLVQFNCTRSKASDRSVTKVCRSSRLVSFADREELLVLTFLDSHFVMAIAQHIKDLASTFGNDCVFYLIEDRRASVRFGRPMAREHSPLLMHLDYQISSVDSLPVPVSLPHQLKPMYVCSSKREALRLTCFVLV